MKFKILEPVVLRKDLRKHGLREGDLGTVVDVCEPDRIGVEFVTASGKTAALVALTTAAVRAVEETDMLAVRSVNARSA